MVEVGATLDAVRVGPVAHGGHWVARVDGRVFFVRHALEGELVRLKVTGVSGRFARADAVTVLEPSPHRVAPPCPVAARCGGCDFQHVDPAHQRELKRQVVAEQLRRLAGIDWDGRVEAFDADALAWRRRMRYHRADDGSWGLRAHRSTDVVPLPPGGCRIAVPGLAEPPASLTEHAQTAIGVAGREGPVWVEPGSDAVVSESAAGRVWSVAADDVWQAHPAAPDALTEAVLAGLQPRPGESAWDLYCGVGLFAGALTEAGLRVTGVEGGRAAVALARGNVPGARFLAGSVDRVLRRLGPSVDLVVLDPPRAGAGRAVVEQVAARRPRRIAYVACDPAALARDLATASGLGYRLVSLRAFDLFGMTHHVECVAVCEPSEA